MGVLLASNSNRACLEGTELMVYTYNIIVCLSLASRYLSVTVPLNGVGSRSVVGDLWDKIGPRSRKSTT